MKVKGPRDSDWRGSGWVETLSQKPHHPMLKSITKTTLYCFRVLWWSNTRVSNGCISVKLVEGGTVFRVLKMKKWNAQIISCNGRPSKPHWWLGLPVQEDGTHCAWYKNFDNDAFTPWPDTVEIFVSIEDLPKDNMLITTVSRCQFLVKISQHNTVSRSCNEVQSSFNDKRVVPNTLVWKYRISCSASTEIHQYNNMSKMKSAEALFLGRSSNGLRIWCIRGRRRLRKKGV